MSKQYVELIQELSKTKEVTQEQKDRLFDISFRLIDGLDILCPNVCILASESIRGNRKILESIGYSESRLEELDNLYLDTLQLANQSIAGEYVYNAVQLFQKWYSHKATQEEANEMQNLLIDAFDEIIKLSPKQIEKIFPQTIGSVKDQWKAIKVISNLPNKPIGMENFWQFAREYKVNSFLNFYIKIMVEIGKAINSIGIVSKIKRKIINLREEFI